MQSESEKKANQQIFKAQVNQHRLDVSVVGAIVATALQVRAQQHDLSKAEGEELEGFISANAIADDDERADALINPTIAHHRANRHHPQHFQNGIHNMTLIDLLEMFCDMFSKHARSQDNFIKAVKGCGDPVIENLFVNTAVELEGVDANFLNKHGAEIVAAEEAAKPKPGTGLRLTSADLAPRSDPALADLIRQIGNQMQTPAT